MEKEFILFVSQESGMLVYLYVFIMNRHLKYVVIFHEKLVTKFKFILKGFSSLIVVKYKHLKSSVSRINSYLGNT